MLRSLFAVLVPAAALFAQPLAVPVLTTDAEVGVHVESNLVSAENFTDTTHWIIFSSGGFYSLRALAPHSGLQWTCTEASLWDINIQVADTDGGVLHLSESVSLYGALERGIDTLWFGEDPTCWGETAGALAPFYELPEAPPEALHIPVPPPTGTPDGDIPPPITNTPLPPF
jgi:hypothetical protein